MKKFEDYYNSEITKDQLIDYLGGSSMGEEGQPDPIEMLLDLLNTGDVKGHRKCVLEWNYDGDLNDGYLDYSNNQSKGK